MSRVNVLPPDYYKIGGGRARRIALVCVIKRRSNFLIFGFVLEICVGGGEWRAPGHHEHGQEGKGAVRCECEPICVRSEENRPFGGEARGIVGGCCSCNAVM